jgi:hypothetical protein
LRICVELTLRRRPRLYRLLPREFEVRVCGVSARSARTSASQAGGSKLLSFAVWMRVYTTATRCAPRSDPANSHDILPGPSPRRARSAELFERRSLSLVFAGV